MAPLALSLLSEPLRMRVFLRRFCEGKLDIKRKRFTEGQIIGVLREYGAGGTTKEICRRPGISKQTFYRWRSKHGCTDVSEAHRLKALGSENAKLKRLLAEAHLDDAALKDLLSKYGEARDARPSAIW